MGIVPTLPGSGYAFFDVPTLDGFSASVGDSRDLQLLDLHIKGHVQLAIATGGLNLVQGCRFDSGLTMNGIGYSYLQSSIVFGDCYINTFHSDEGRNTIIDGTLTVYAGGTTNVRNNVVVGPADGRDHRR